MLAILLREPFSGMTPWLFMRLPYRVILGSYFAPRDDKGQLIPEGEGRQRDGEEDDGQITGDPDRARRELPKPKDLGIPVECLRVGVNAGWVVMFWQVWRGRGKTTEEILEIWRRVVKRG